MNSQPHDHIVRSYDEERQRLTGEILRMGAMAMSQLEAALDVVERRDDSAAAHIVDALTCSRFALSSWSFDRWMCASATTSPTGCRIA